MAEAFRTQVLDEGGAAGGGGSGLFDRVQPAQPVRDLTIPVLPKGRILGPDAVDGLGRIEPG